MKSTEFFWQLFDTGITLWLGYCNAHSVVEILPEIFSTTNHWGV